LFHFFILYFYIYYINCEFNLYEIYPKKIVNLQTIKIIHKTINSSNKTLCVFGVLNNNMGKIIEEEMLKWLIPNYNVYIVYQKYPGKLYEYPALKFAQYLINKINQTLLLYVHSKGAFYPKRRNIQKVVRLLWKYEFSGDNKKKYIFPILNNQTDVSTMFTGSFKTTWFNGFYVSQRALNIIRNLDRKLKKRKKRHKYETLFRGTKVRVLGIIKNNVNKKVHFYARKYFKKIYSNNKINIKSDL